MPQRPVPKKLSELSALLQAELVGDGTFEIADVAHPLIADAGNQLALAMDSGSFKALANTRARAAIVEARQDIDLDRFVGGLRVGEGQTRVALVALLKIFARPPHAPPGVHPSAVVDDSATLGESVSVGPFVYVGPEARIGAGSRLMAHVSVGAQAAVGENALLHPGVRIGERCRIGDGVVINMNATIGSDGFGFTTPQPGSVDLAHKFSRSPRVEGRNTEILKINTIGNVVIGDNVEIGANTSVDSGTLGPTMIGTGTKIDNQVQIGHNCRIGENCLIAGQVGIAGSTKLGDRVVVAGGAGISDHRTIGDDSIILPLSGVGQDVPPQEIWGGYPAMRKDLLAEEMMNISRIKRLIREVRTLRESVDALRGD